MPKLQLKKLRNWSINIYIEMALLLLYKVMIDWSFQSIMLKNYVIPEITNFNIIKFVISILMVLILYFMNEKGVNNIVLRFLIKSIILIMFIPISTIYIYSNNDFLTYFILFFEIALTIFVVILLQNKEINLKAITREKNFSKIIYYIFLVNTFIVIGACLIYNHLPTLTALNLKNVYEVRNIFYLPKIIRYLYDFEVKFIVPFLIVLYLHNKKYIKMVWAILLQILFFLWKGDKIVLLSIPLIIGTYFIFEFFKNYNKDRMLTVLITIITAITIIIALMGSYLSYSLIVRRTFIVPANLKFIYFDFFDNNPKIGIYGTIFNAIIKNKNPYDNLQYQNIVGGEYFGDSKMFANTGYLVEGFVRWGYIGIFIIPIILGVVMIIIQHGCKNNSTSFIAGISILPIYSLNDGYLIPSMTFGAIALLIIICLCFKTENFMFNRGKKEKES